MSQKDILLVEDNPDDVELTRIAFAEANVANRLEVVGDGAQALDYLFARGEYAHRDPGDLPSIVLLDLNLPKVDGREVLQAIRANEKTRGLPVVRSEEHTSELQSLMRISYAVFCLKKKNNYTQQI